MPWFQDWWLPVDNDNHLESASLCMFSAPIAILPSVMSLSLSHTHPSPLSPHQNTVWASPSISTSPIAILWCPTNASYFERPLIFRLTWLRTRVPGFQASWAQQQKYYPTERTWIKRQHPKRLLSTPGLSEGRITTLKHAVNPSGASFLSFRQCCIFLHAAFLLAAPMLLGNMTCSPVCINWAITWSGFSAHTQWRKPEEGRAAWVSPCTPQSSSQARGIAKTQKLIETDE